MIRNMTKFQDWPPAGFDGQFHWEFLNGAFGDSIKPMDVDAIVERNGRFLVFETKHPDVAIPWGQQRSLKALVRTGFVSVMILYGKSADEIESYIIWHENTERLVKPANAESVYERCAQWYEWVNRLGEPEYPDQLQSLIEDLRRENSQLRSSLENAHSRISVLNEYVSRIERTFKLEPSKAKAPRSKSMALALECYS